MGLKYLVLVLPIISSLCYAKTPMPDIPVSTVYNPVITIGPDQYAEKYPERLPVKLIINELGKVEKVIYSENTPDKYKQIIDKNMQMAKFTPYMKQGIAVKSVVPFTVRFNILSEYDYNGEIGD